MAKITKTYGELLGLVQTMNALGSNKEFADANTKGMKKITKVGERLKGVLETYNEKLEDIRLDNAHTDDKGCLITDEKGGYKYSKEGTKKLNKDIRALLQETFEVDQFTFSTEGIENYLFFAGWVAGIEMPKMEQSEDDEVEIIEETPVVSL